MLEIKSLRTWTKATLKTWWMMQILRYLQYFSFTTLLFVNKSIFITLNLICICNLDLYDKDCFFQNGYQSRTRNLVEDAKLESISKLFLLPCSLLSSPCFITLNLLWICNLDLYDKDCFFQNGYQSRTRNLVEDAKFESRVNEENKRNWIQSIRQQSEGNHSWNAGIHKLLKSSLFPIRLFTKIINVSQKLIQDAGDLIK